ncbi:hypothetical protein L798_00102 [Zootermopsis nevadensis]|uniref:Shugoshin C-terminal domain-containing protein n=1 Tax=Zootermopsis nevadensis TaxID=136037 RepID=A0A067RKU3_ZOONE|nr:hypothetical protein L798_00102 [Zootermopsis nevadensis]
MKMKRKSLSFSFLSKSGSRKWRSNNLQLARENARLRKDIQRCKQLLMENTIRYNILEVSWRRRGETLSKIDVTSRLIGNQVLKLVDSLTEIRSACQVELSIPVGGIKADNADRISRCRHTVPNIKMGSFTRSHNLSQLSSKSQPVNHVNPMVSGHPIIKPTITLQRLNLQDVRSNSPLEQIRSPLQELDEGQIAETDLATIAENSVDPPLPSSYNSDEEEAVELSITPSMRRITARSSPPSYHNIILPVAEVPLERLSLARILGRHKEAMKRDMFSGILMNENKTDSISNCVSATSSHSDRSLQHFIRRGHTS